MAGREGGMQDWSEVAANGWVATQRECLRTRNLVRRTDHCRVTSITDTHHHRREISDMEVMKKRQAPARNATQPGRLFSPGGIAGSYSPPFVLPGEHFAAALGAWVLGCAGLVWVAPEVASGLFPLPRVIAVTHLFTLGWITLSILGALYQFLPVALGVAFRWERLGHVAFWLYAPGLVAFVAGLVWSWPLAMVGGAIGFTTALLLFLTNLVATLVRAPERGLTWWALFGAAISLFLTVVLGLMLVANLRTGFLADRRFVGVGVHAHVALAGWVMLVVIGVAHRLLPMFLLSHGAREWPGKAAGWLVGGGVGLLAVLYHSGWFFAQTLPGALIWLGVAIFLVQAAEFYRTSRKPRLDAGMRLAGAALVHLAIALVLAPLSLSRGVAAPRLAVAYFAAVIVGGFGLFVAAHHYKIVPFLVWFHRFGPLVGKGGVPQVADLYDGRVAHVAAALLALGAAGLVASIVLGAPVAARASAIALLAGAVTEAGQMYAVSRRRPE